MAIVDSVREAMSTLTLDADRATKPGRSCPVRYRYAPRELARPADLYADTLYVIGGLYGNPLALEAVLHLRDAEVGPVTLVFNGDFNWFNVDSAGFAAINEAVLGHVAVRGNVEAELAEASPEAGCGCAYPDWVEDTFVERSNAIMEQLHHTARAFPHLRARLGALPMHRVAEVGGLRIGIVHGDAESLAGWRFAQENLPDTAHADALERYFSQASVRIFACTHTCLPVCQAVDLPEGAGVIVNNGSAGMPNFRGCRYGLVTRVSTRPFGGVRPVYGMRVEDLHVDALPVEYDHDAWCRMFLSNWPPGSPAYESYLNRILHGPDYAVDKAIRGT